MKNTSECYFREKKHIVKLPAPVILLAVTHGWCRGHFVTVWRSGASQSTFWLVQQEAGELTHWM